MLRRTALPAELKRLSNVIQPHFALISEIISQTISAEQSYSQPWHMPLKTANFMPVIPDIACSPCQWHGWHRQQHSRHFRQVCLTWPFSVVPYWQISWLQGGCRTHSADAVGHASCRDVKRAHRERAVRLQTSEDPLQVSLTTSRHRSTVYLFNTPSFCWAGNASCKHVQADAT